jgi:hypothetical protein
MEREVEESAQAAVASEEPQTNNSPQPAPTDSTSEPEKK